MRKYHSQDVGEMGRHGGQAALGLGLEGRAGRQDWRGSLQLITRERCPDLLDTVVIVCTQELSEAMMMRGGG